MSALPSLEELEGLEVLLGLALWTLLLLPRIRRNPLLRRALLSMVPPLVRALPLEEAPRGHVEMERRENYGKLIMLTAFGRSLPADKSIELI